MSTLIESINKITEIKQDLNQVLRDNGLEGGDVFTDYPDKFRELFRVMTTLADSTTEGYKAPETTVITNVPDPTLSQYQNVVYVTNNLDEATIYYYVKTDSGNNEIGVTALEKGKSIIVSEPSTVYVYAQYRAERSSTVSIYVPWAPEVVPDPPVIYRNGTTVTITCNEGDEIYYNIGDEFVLYQWPLTVPLTVDVYAFAQNYRGRSDTVVDEAPEKPSKPEVPDISCSLNVVTITCGTENATIYYRRTTESLWTKYTGHFTIDRSGFYVAKSEKDGVFSDDSDAVWCEYYAVPADPTITCTDNMVYIVCSTNGAEIYYKIGENGTYVRYDAPFPITETVTVYSYSTKGGFDSNVVSVECVYATPVSPVPENPVFSCTDNIVQITCATEGAYIYYKSENDQYWIRYERPIEITEDTSFEAYSSKNGYISQIVEYDAEYVAPVTPIYVSEPVFSLFNNIITLTCSTVGANIYYRNYNSGEWILYSGPFAITESGMWLAYAEKNGKVSNTVQYNATYEEDIVIPDTPVITCQNNIVTITCDTENATIWYRINNTGLYQMYVGQFNISSSITVTAYSLLDGVQSLYATKQCSYWDIENVDWSEGETIEPTTGMENVPMGFEMEESGTFIYKYKQNPNLGEWGWKIEYNINGGEWVAMTLSDFTTERINVSYVWRIHEFELNSGDTISFRANSSLMPADGYGILGFDNNFYSAARHKVFGNIYSLVYPTNYSSKYKVGTFKRDGGLCWGMFMDSNVTDASDLVMPWIPDDCTWMFQNCKMLEYPPKIYASNTYGMFWGCSSLRAIPYSSTVGSSMYTGCTSLNYDYYGDVADAMFANCISMKYIKIKNASKNAMYKVGGTGVVVIPENKAETYTRDYLALPDDWSILYY